MATKQSSPVHTPAIDELIEQTNIERMSAKRIQELREQAKAEAVMLYQAKQWEIGKDLPLNNGTIRLYREKVYTWEQNHQIEDGLISVYCAQLQHIEWLKEQMKKTREELKATAINLERAHPNSSSIKYELKFQVR